MIAAGANMQPRRVSANGILTQGFDLLRRVYCWLSDRVYRDLAWAFEPLTTVLTGGWLPRWRRAMLPCIPPGDVLDLACGTGALLDELGRARSFDARGRVGIDLSPAMASIAHNRGEGRAAAWIVRANAHHLPFHDGCFNSVIATFPTRFALEPDVLREARRVMSDAGVGPNKEGHTTPGTGRLVILGLYVRSARRIVQRALDALYGAPVAQLQDRFVGRLMAAGFELIPEGLPQGPAGFIQPTLHVAVARPTTRTQREGALEDVSL